MNSLTPLLSPFLSAFQSFTHISGGGAPCKRGFRARTNCHGVTQSDFNRLLFFLPFPGKVRQKEESI